MNKKFLILLLIVISSAFILSSCGMEDGIMDATLTQEENADLIEKYRQQNQENLDKIREYDLKEQDKYNGKTNFESDSSNGASLGESQYKNNTNPTAPSFGSRSKNEDIIEDEAGNKLDHWFYYDAEEDEWGDAYYYVIKTKDGRENYEYAYSMLNGKKKIYKKLNGSRGQVIIVPEDYKVPEEYQKWADDRFITIIHMPDSEFEYEYYDEEGFSDPYEKYEYYNSKEAKAEVAEKINDVRSYYLSQPNPKINKDYIDNLNRRIEENENSSSLDKSNAYMFSLIEKYGDSTKDLLKLAKSEEEKEEIQYIDMTAAELGFDNIELFSNIGYKSELVVIRFNNQINKIMKRSEAHKVIKEVFDEKFKIIEEAATNQDLKSANELSISCPSAREFDINNKISKLMEEFSKKYREKSKIINHSD